MAAPETPDELPDPEAYAREVNRYPAPDGTEFAWRRESGPGGFGLDWSTDPVLVKGKRCRFGASRGKTACGVEAVAILNRSAKKDRPRWWGYCAEHLFGRLLAAGQVWKLILVEVEDEEVIPSDG